MVRLALVCKGCGQPLNVPESSTIPEPESRKVEPPKPAPKLTAIPVPAAALRSVAPPAASPATHYPAEVASSNGTLATQKDDDECDFLFEKPDALAELDLDPANRLPELPVEKIALAPPIAPPAPAHTGGRKLIAVIVDIAVALILLAIGVVCGELLAKQSSRDVLRDAGSAAKFPPLELLMWMSPTLVILLVYALLVSRGKSVGAWLKRRAAS